MISSMTGYAVKSRDLERGLLQIELKSVNSRYLDIHFRVMDELRALELPLRELLTTRLSRGKVECRLSFNVGAARSETLEVNPALLAAVESLQTRIQAALPGAASLSVGEVLRWPGMLGDQSVDFSALAPEVMRLAREVLDEFLASRSREGQKLAQLIVDRVNAMRDIVRAVAPKIPEAQAVFTDRLRQRLQEALVNPASEDRILQEVAVFATRIDVAEEIGRLMTHLDEVERVLQQGGACGKRLDFLMQELNREANTLGSKSALVEVSQASMELKLLIEQMREQIQNLE